MSKGMGSNKFGLRCTLRKRFEIWFMESIFKWFM